MCTSQPLFLPKRPLPVWRLRALHAALCVSQDKTNGSDIEVIADRFKPSVPRSRAVEAVETALRLGKGLMELKVRVPGSEEEVWKFSAALTCPECGITYARPHDSTFSFNSPLGACDTCRGFGRIIGVD